MAGAPLRHFDEAGARIVLIGVAAAAFVALVAIEIGNPVKNSLFNADTNYMLLFVGDLLRGGSPAGWNIAPHLYLVPDAAMTLVILAGQALGLGPYPVSVALYGAAAIGIGTLLWRHCTGDGAARSAAWASVIVGVALAVPAWFPGREAMVAAILVPAGHSGAMLTAPLCFLLLESIVAAVAWRWRERTRLAALVALIAVMVFSDLIFVPWGVAPLYVVLASQFRHARRRRLAVVAAAIGGGAVAGYLLSLWLGRGVAERYFADAVMQHWRDSTDAAVSYFRAGATFAEPLRGVILYANMALWIAGLWAVVADWRGSPAPRWRATLIFVAASSAVSVAATLALGVFTLNVVRFFTPFVLWGIVAVVVAVPAALSGRRRWETAVLGAGLLLALMAGFRLSQGASPLATDTLAACLDARHLDSGVASYWDALPLMAETRWRIHVVSLTPNATVPISPFHWLIKDRWLTRRADTDAPVSVSFGIVGSRGPGETGLVAAFGPSSRRFVCAGQTILVFDPPRTLPWGR